jgi:hypothetical protein
MVNKFYAVYEPDDVNCKIVFNPLVVTVGEPVVFPEYPEVGIDRITTPLPPLPPAALPLLFDPPPPPVFTLPEFPEPFPPPPAPPEYAVGPEPKSGEPPPPPPA